LDATVLAFDTSAAHCAAALLSGGRIVTSVSAMSLGQAEALMPALENLLGREGLVWANLDAVAVGTGPGNFTGIRISVAAARGLALGLGIPAIGVSGFEAAAFGQTRPVTVTLPAPRGQIYVQRLHADGSDPPEVRDGSAIPLPPEALVAAIARIAATRIGQDLPRPAPFYVRAADAAPSRDPAPVILPG
jgi:tRNA threonylcarbamoyladenosine biosynthesis protein TsaB